jgi:hypothetical protein
MRLVWRAVVVLVVSVGVGWLAAWAVIAHAAVGGAPPPEVRLSSAMGALAAGGLAAVITGIALLRHR